MPRAWMHREDRRNVTGGSRLRVGCRLATLLHAYLLRLGMHVCAEGGLLPRRRALAPACSPPRGRGW